MRPTRPSTPAHSRFAILALLLAAVAGCASDAVERGLYEALYQKQCMDTSGTPDCDAAHPSYDRYRRDRDDALRQVH